MMAVNTSYTYPPNPYIFLWEMFFCDLCYIITGADNYLCDPDEGLLRTARQHYARVLELISQHFAEQVMHTYGLQQPTEWKDSLQLYLKSKDE